MTQEEMIRQRQELVHTMFSSTGDEFVRLVMKNCRSGVSALTADLRERMHTQEFKYKDFIWYKFQTG